MTTDSLIITKDTAKKRLKQQATNLWEKGDLYVRQIHD